MISNCKNNVAIISSIISYKCMYACYLFVYLYSYHCCCYRHVVIANTSFRSCTYICRYEAL